MWRGQLPPSKNDTPELEAYMRFGPSTCPGLIFACVLDGRPVFMPMRRSVR